MTRFQHSPEHSRLPDRAADAALRLASLFPLLLLALLTFTLAGLAPARAGEPPACAGTDLLPGLKAGEPARYAALRREADRIPNGKGIFWKIEKEGLAPSWLIGTMHVTDPRVMAMPEAARQPYAEAATVVIESTDVLDEQKTAAAFMAHPELTMIAGGRTIPELLGEEKAKELEAGLQERGIPLAAVSRMQPWLISSFLALPACEMARKQGGLAIFDKKLALDAQEAGKEVLGLETMTEQLQAISGLPVEFHLQGLIETLALGERMTDIFETMTALYLAGEPGAIMPMLKAAAPGTVSEDEGYAAFEERLILTRNHTMAERARGILEKGNAFIAIGALHLPGEEGVVSLLQEQGFTLTPMH